MYLLSSRETSLLNARFARVLRVGLMAAAALAIGLTVNSIVQDRKEARGLSERGDRYASASTRIYVDQMLDQAYYSLMGIDSDLRAQALRNTGVSSMPDVVVGDEAVRDAMALAMRYDPISRVMFLRRDDHLVAMDRHDRPIEAFLPRLRELPPAVPGQNGMRLLPPVKGPEGTYLLPVLLALAPPFSPEADVGALIPIEKLRARAVSPAGEQDEGDMLLLTDGTVVARTVAEAAWLGTRRPETVRIADRARTEAQGATESTGTAGEPITGYYQRSERYPFIAVSAKHTRVYLDPWRLRSVGKVTMLVIGLAAIGWFARSLFRLNTVMASSEATYRRLFEDVSDCMMLMRADGTIAGLNTSMARLLGLEKADEAIDRPAHAFYRPTDGTEADAQRLARVLAGEYLHYQLPYRVLGPGQVIECDLRLSPIDIGDRRMMLSVVRDISAERRHARQQEYLVNHDALTGLPNRHSLLRTLDRQLEEHPDQAVHLVVVNLARFREVNESVGPRTGDTVLEVCAQRLSNTLGAMDWRLFRSGGAEFVALGLGDRLPGLDALRRSVLQVLGEPVAVGDTTIELHARMGATHYPEDALDASQLLRCAEIAALHARQEVEQWTRYTRALDRSPGRDLKLRAELGAAIREGQLRLFFQPKLWLEDRGIAGAEALLRWNHPERGWVSPGEFIPLAESTELIHPLTRWVVGEAVEQIHAWAAAGHPLPLAVNISVNNLRDPDFTGYVKALLARKRVAPELLELEVTEGALARDPEIMLRRMQELRDAGLRLSLDDFGTGFSGLSYVSQFPFTSIKIDRSFVDALLGGHREREVAKSAIALGRGLDMRTIAEGVENDETAAALLALECDIGQGYLFGRPMPLQEFDAWRAKHEATQLRATDFARLETEQNRRSRVR